MTSSRIKRLNEPAASSSFDTHVCYFSESSDLEPWCSRSQVRLPIDDIGFRQGVTVVERLRTYQGKPFAVLEHLQRWTESIAALRIRSALSNSSIADLLDELLRRNERLVSVEKDVGITMFATPGVKDAETATIGLHLNRLDHGLIGHRCRHGQPVVVTNVQQQDQSCWPRSIKVRCRVHYYLADAMASDQADNAIGLLIDQDGSITETSIANVAIVEAGDIISPERKQVLSGVTQSVIERLAKVFDIQWRHERISPDRLRGADEVLLMGTDAGLWFADRVNGTTTGTMGPGSVCRRLQSSFDQHTRKTDAS